MKKASIIALILAVFAALAQATTINGIVLGNPMPGSEAGNSYAWIPDVINGDTFTYPAVAGVNSPNLNVLDWHTWMVVQGWDDNLGPNAIAPALPAGTTASLWIASETNPSATFTLEGTTTSFSPWQYPTTGTNYLSYPGGYLGGKYLPIFQIDFNSLNFNLAPDTYFWAVTLTYPAGSGITSTLLTDTYAACAAGSAYPLPNTCDGDIWNINPGANTANFYDYTQLSVGGAPPGSQGNVGYDVNFLITTPEPGTWLLIAAGAGVLALSRRRRS